MSRRAVLSHVLFVLAGVVSPLNGIPTFFGPELHWLLHWMGGLSLSFSVAGLVLLYVELGAASRKQQHRLQEPPEGDVR